MFVNGEFVDDDLVRMEAAYCRERLRVESPELDDFDLQMRAMEVARELVIERRLLRQAALNDSTPIPAEWIDAEVKRFYAQSPQQAGCLLPRDQETMRASIEDDLRIQRFIGALTANVPKPSSKPVAAFYQHAKESLALPETIHAAHIVKNVNESVAENDALAAIKDIQARLEQGIPFETVADEHSDCPGRGGDLGFFARGEMVAEFDAAVFNLAAGDVSPIFRTPFGFHIVKVYERRAAHLPSLKEVRGEIEEAIWRQAKNDRVRAYMDELRARAEVRKSK